MISWNEAFQLVYTMIVLYFWDRKCHFSDLTLLNKQKKNNPKISKFGLSGQNLRENTRKNIQNHLILSNFEPVITGRCINGNSTEVLTSKIKLAVITMASNWTQRSSTVKFRFGKWKKYRVNPYMAGITVLEAEYKDRRRQGNEHMDQFV